MIFQELSEAYSVLGDAEKKAEYDELFKHFYDISEVNCSNTLYSKPLSQTLFWFGAFYLNLFQVKDLIQVRGNEFKFAITNISLIRNL